VRSPSPVDSPIERGGVTAEFMITLPVVIMVFVTLSLGFGAALAKHQIQQLSSDHARVLSYGGNPALLPGVPPGATATSSVEGDLVCVHYHYLYDRGAWALHPLNLGASACALAPPSW
jgi:hypothetical protein